MGMSVEEMMKIFDFLIENKELIVSDKGLFSFDTLKKIRAIVKGKISNDFKLTEEQKQLIIEAFINGNQAFSEETPNFLLENESCIKAAINRDISSIDFLLFLPPDLEDYIIEKAKEQNFVLKENSRSFIKACYEIALNSIQLDVTSADFVIWECISEDKVKVLIDKVIENGYVLSENSAPFLRKNKKVVFSSIRKDLESFEYADRSMKEDYFIVKYLLFNNYGFSERDISRFSLKLFVNPEFMECCLKKMDTYQNNDKEYIRRVARLYSDALKKLPSISTFQSAFEYVVESEWEEFRKENLKNFNNIFGIICAELKSSTELGRALNNLQFMELMSEHLGEKKYDILIKAMDEYFHIVHSEMDDKLSKIQKSKDTIAELSALYVSKAKENYKKEKLDDCYNLIREYFTLRRNNPAIEKKILSEKQKDKFEYLYNINDIDIMEFLDKIVQKYNHILNKNFINTMIHDFIVYRYSKLSQITTEPKGYSNYVRYEKAVKLIHRLNNGFIQYDGVEMTNYHDIVSYDEGKKKYIYSGRTFSQGELKTFEKYKLELEIFEKIKREIASKVGKMKVDVVDDQIDEDLLESLTEELPFTDEYFIFDPKTLEEFSLGNLFYCGCLNGKFKKNNFKSDLIYDNIYQLLVNNGMIWLLLLLSRQRRNFISSKIEEREIFYLINNMDEITKLSNQFHFNLANFKELLLAYKMSEYTNAKSLSILGKEVTEKIYKDREYTDSEPNEIISMATELVAQMTKRNKSTVPYVHGQTANYKYSLYDSQDETLLLAGINTDACFRIAGNDNDFLHYCALDKNGFVIKITDYAGDFIARASGFRNGNCIFINQLRTIYDRGGSGYRGNYESEQGEIIEIFKKACEDILSTSQKNEKEVDKIEHVFVTASYSLYDFPSNVPTVVERKIGDNPMDYYSEDWEYFTDNVEYLQETGDSFSTDYGNYALICMASIKKPEDLLAVDIKRKNVDALYERERKPIIVTDLLNDSIFKKINKIAGVYSYLEKIDFEKIEIPKHSTVFMGDNWYIIYYNGCITNSCLLEFDEKAKVEFEATKKILEDHILSCNEGFNIEEVINSMESFELEETVKVKKYL